MRKYSHNFRTNRAAHVIRMILMSFSVYFAPIFFSHVVWNSSTFFHAKFILWMKYHLLITWIWCEKFSHQIHIRRFKCENDTKNFAWILCLFFMSIWHEKNFTRNSYVIRVKMIRKILRMKFIRGTFGSVGLYLDVTLLYVVWLRPLLRYVKFHIFMISSF